MDNREYYGATVIPETFSGKVLGIVILVLLISRGGGNFPIEVSVEMQGISVIIGVFGSKFIKKYFDKFDTKYRESRLVH